MNSEKSIAHDLTFSPGPWVVSTDEDIGKGWMVATTGDYVIEVRGRKGDELGDALADAHLIAAAPALYAALRKLLDWSDHNDTCDVYKDDFVGATRSCTCGFREVYRQVDAALTGATGGEK